MADNEIKKLTDKGLAVLIKFPEAEKAKFRELATPELIKYVKDAGYYDLYVKIQEIK